MTAGDLAAVVLSVVMIGVIVAMALLAQALLRTLREPALDPGLAAGRSRPADG